MDSLEPALWEMVRSELEVVQCRVQERWCVWTVSLPLWLAQQLGFHPAGLTRLSRNQGEAHEFSGVLGHRGQ